MRNVENCVKIKKAQSESADSHRMKVLLCKLGKKLGFEVDIKGAKKQSLEGSQFAMMYYGTLATQSGTKNFWISFCREMILINNIGN